MATRNRMAASKEELPQRLPAQLVQDFHAAFGEHHARAVHTKGLIILQGTYAPSALRRGSCAAPSSSWMPDGSNTDIVSHSFNGFPVSTSSDFSALLQAIAHSGGEPSPGSELDKFLSSHPTAKTFFTTQTQLRRAGRPQASTRSTPCSSPTPRA